MTDETRDESGRLVSVVVDGQRFHRSPEASEERSDQDGFTVPTWQDLRHLADHNFGLYAEAAAEVRSLRRVVQAATETRGRVEAVIARYRDYRGGFDQIRQERADFADVLQAALEGDEELARMTGLSRAALAAAADAPQPAPKDDQR